MTNFKVLFTASIEEEIETEADTPEEAVAKLVEEFRAKVMRDVRLRPKWVEVSEKLEATGQYGMEIIGPCPECGNQIVHGQRVLTEYHPSWKYLSRESKEHNYESLCYPCSLPALKQLALQDDD